MNEITVKLKGKTYTGTFKRPGLDDYTVIYV